MIQSQGGKRLKGMSTPKSKTLHYLKTCPNFKENIVYLKLELKSSFLKGDNPADIWK